MAKRGIGPGDACHLLGRGWRQRRLVALERIGDGEMAGLVQNIAGMCHARLINQDRARYGLRPLTWSSCLASVAISNAARMAGAERMWHANGVYSDLACHLGNRTGENIGYWTGGVNDSRLNTMFMNSPEHKANILGPYRYVATAWRVAANGTAYIAVEFS